MNLIRKPIRNLARWASSSASLCRVSRPALSALILASTAWLPVEALHPNHPLDIGPEQKAEGFSEGLDAIDLYSGALSLGIPIGPLRLNYSSNVWRYDQDTEGEITASPHRLNNAGLGFHLGWGEILSPSHALNPSDRWIYVNGSGGEHSFYSTLHKEEDNVDDGVFYTRDNSYLRLKVQNDGTGIHHWVEVEFPGGSTQRFECISPPGEGCGLGSVYRLKKGWTPFASLEDPDFEVTYSDFNDDGHPELWALTNRYGLEQRVYLDGSGPWVILRVTRVEVESFDEQMATYDFTYRTQSIERSCKDTSPTTGQSISVPLLVGLDLPDGTSYQFTGPQGGPLYHQTCFAGIDDVSGVLRGVTVPTGGEISWGWQENEFPPGDNHSEFNTSAGVSLRVLRDSEANLLGVWKYKSTGVPRGEPDNLPENDPQMITEVVYPTGHCSKHFFNARYWVTPSQGRGWELGLPFVYTEESGGKFLSSQTWSSNDGAGSCTGVKSRSNYLRFRRDSPPGQAPDPSNSVTLGDFYATNRQVEASRTVFHLDDRDTEGAERYTDSESSEFDGLGHFRRVVDTGNFRDESETAERRETFIGFNRTTGTYPGPSYVPVPPTTPWILGIYDRTRVTEPDALGVQVAEIETSYEEDTGFLTCTRVFANGTSRGPTDILTVRTRDQRGRVIDFKQYGGDLFPGHDSPLPVTGEGCGEVPVEADYWATLAYDPLSGVHVSTRPRTVAGGNGPFLIYDVDVEAKTGLVLRQRDAAGFEVAYTYDSSGRVVSVTPIAGAKRLLGYLNPTATEPAAVMATLVTPDDETVLSEQTVLLDDFGRSSLTRVRLPGANTWSEQETLRNGRGWVTSVSQWGDLEETTENLVFDPQGRVELIRPPDGASHDVRITHLGSRKITQEVKRALSGGEVYVQQSQEFDRYGRLVRVQEPSGATGETVTTTYRYDVGNRLTEVHMAELANPQDSLGENAALFQTRSFQYDERGLLLSETHPEKGVNGNGTVTYENYDSAGLAHGMVDGPNSVGFVYDFVGRPLRLLDRNHESRLITEYKWDGGSGYGVGKLWKADRYNDVHLSWNEKGEERVQIRQKFDYDGLGGRASKKATSIFWSSENVRFKQEFTYDELGALETAVYPYCSLPTACSNSEAGSSRTILNSHEQGRLTQVEELSSVPGGDPIFWAGPITYHASGARNALPHANGVTDFSEVDDHWTQLPKRIYTSGTSPGFDSGVMSYDGAGNLKALAREVAPNTTVTDAFTYDEVGRLKEASYLDDSVISTFSYDSFGNLQSAGGFTGGMAASLTTDSSTNRLQGGVYDGAGNLLSAAGIAATFTYDISNRLTGQAGRNYLYDAFGERTIRLAQIPEEAASFHLRDLDNRLVSEVSLDEGAWSRYRDYIFADGNLLASSGPGSTERHFHLDHLGSTRLVTGPSGSTEREIFYLPYGGADLSEDARFTGHERDASTGSDYMHARHYLSDLGRFLSVDPILGDPSQPQSWNRYVYAKGNPLNLIDPRGLKAKCANGEVEDENTGACLSPQGTASEEIDVTATALPDGSQEFRVTSYLGSFDTLTWNIGFSLAPVMGSSNFISRFLDGIASIPLLDLFAGGEPEGEDKDDPTRLVGFNCNAILKPTFGASFSGGTIFPGGAVDIILQPPTRVELLVAGPIGVGAGTTVFAGLGIGSSEGPGVGGTGNFGVGGAGIVSANLMEDGSAAGFAGIAFSAATLGSGGGGKTHTWVLYDGCK
ncbi:MAG: RHS repeat-associated core domain-containing protein [Deltaproteobacteria bacterium]|nr:RHS repeat-associated core domain-containing protein [Deltaproteobacteria bacterium]